MLERNEGQVVEPIMCLQVIDEAAHPRDFSGRIRPNSDVFVDSFKHRTAELQFGIDLVNCRRPLNVKGSVILRHGVFAVGSDLALRAPIEANRWLL